MTPFSAGTKLHNVFVMYSQLRTFVTLLKKANTNYFLSFSEEYLFSLPIDVYAAHYAPFQFCKYVPMHVCHLGKDLFP